MGGSDEEVSRLAEDAAESAPAVAPGSESASHRRTALILVIVASITGFFLVFAIWAKRQVLETDSWVETSTKLLEREDIREALAGFLVDELYTNVDVEQQIAGILPPEARGLAGPASGALRQAADQIALRALEDARVQALWETANRTAHEALISAVEGGTDNVSTEDGAVILDLRSILAQIAGEIGLPTSLVDKLPADAAQLEILRANELEAAQDAVALFKKGVWILLVVTLFLYGLALYLAGAYRRETLRSIGIGFIVVGALVLLIRSWAGDQVVSSLAATSSSEPAIASTWSIATSMLSEIGGATIIYGIAFVIAAWLAGPTSLATGARRLAVPYLRQPRFAFAAAAILLLLIFWWSPTPGTERLGPSLVLVALVLLGTEMLRRRTIAEFPDRTTTFSAAGLAGTLAAQSRDAIGRRVRVPSRREQAATESKLDALERLGRLRESGVLTDEEFAAEKTGLLAGEDES